MGNGNTKLKMNAGRLTSAARLLVCAMCAVSLCGCFILKQGRYLLKYSLEAERTEKLLRRVNISEDMKMFISLVDEIRGYASDSIGLVKNDNFSKYIDVHKSHIVDVVYGAGKLNFTPYTWRFPFFGSFPNKGFFELKDARKEADGLIAKGYDACILPAGAFSTLGFFSDPVYSFMMRYSPFRLASIIFHEQTHATLFIKSQMQFNEELATFIGNEGGLRFIRSKFGDTSEHYRNALDVLHDESVFSSLMKSLRGELKTAYDSTGITDENKLQLKQSIIARFKDSVESNYDSLFRSPAYRGLPKMEINNAFIAADMTYTLNLSMFRDLYKRKNRDFKAMLASLKPLKKQKGDPHALMKKLE